MPGNLFVISAPSGAGKTSLVRGLLKLDPQVSLSVSYTTRSPRPGEQDGSDYHFVSRETFLEMTKRGEFMESAEVYGNLYGTSQAWISQQLGNDQDILLEIDWQGAAQVRRLFPACIGIFILPPSRDVLVQRLKSRGKDDESVIARRMAAVRDDVAHVAEFDYVIINEDLNEALRELTAVVRAARVCRDRQLRLHQPLINQLQNPE